jgi:hypothetical protein
MDNKTAIVRCFNKKIHTRSDGVGNVLCFIRGDSIFIKCTDQGCKRWTRLLFRLPGVNVDFDSAVIIQKLMPEGYQFDAIPAKTVFETEEA